MVAKGSYTPRSGVLAGTTFPSYYRYQTARAQQQGFTSYAQQRVQQGIGNPLPAMMINRAVSRGGMTRAEATARVRTWFQTQPKVASVPARDRTATAEQALRKHNAIAWLIDHAGYPSGEDYYDDVPY